MVQLFLNTSVVPFKMYFENSEFYFRKYIEILKFSKIFFEKYLLYGKYIHKLKNIYIAK